MAFLFINPGITGTYQTLFNRLKEDVDTVDLTDTPATGSGQSVPFDGVDDKFTFDNIFNVNLGVATATELAIEAWVKPNVSGLNKAVWSSFNIVRDPDTTSPGYDGFYETAIVRSGAASATYVEFTIKHAQKYTLTSQNTVTNSADWNHLLCEYVSGSTSANGTMRIWIDGAIDREGTLNSVSVMSSALATGNNHAFGGALDELRLWVVTAAATAVNTLASLTSVGLNPEGTLQLNEYSPTANTLVAWYRLETLSAFQLFSAVADSIENEVSADFPGTPVNFEGADIVSYETTVVAGLSASGDLVNIEGGSIDHGGLTFIDPQNNANKIILETGGENLIVEPHNNWVATGSSTITLESNNIFYGASSIKINTSVQDTGAYQDISNSAVLYTDNPYTTSMRLRAVSGSTSARVEFKLGTSAASITAVFGTDAWEPITVTNHLGGTTLTGRVTVTQLNSGADNGSLFNLDGFQVVEGLAPISFIGENRTRKSSQVYWPVED